jgi:hypothetical protein
VIGGPGAFVVPIQEREKFKEATRANAPTAAGARRRVSFRRIRPMRRGYKNVFVPCATIHNVTFPARRNDPMAECLHCQINELVKAHLEADDPADLNDLVARIIESAAELIVDVVAEEDQASVLAGALSHLGHSYLEKSGAFGDAPASTH